jgi:acetyl esterase/lipase
VVESWSGYFHATNPAGTAALELGSVDADDWASAHKQIARAKRFLSGSRARTYFAFYVGTGDPPFRTENEEFYLELKEAGLTGIVFRLDTGGHSWTSGPPMQPHGLPKNSQSLRGPTRLPDRARHFA